MNILGINNAFAPTQIVFGNENDILFSIKENPPSKYPNNILYLINEFFIAFHLNVKDIEIISVVNGPGSFTGTRIGVVEAKIMAYLLSVPLVTVNSLDIIGSIIDKGWAILPAGRGQIFAARFQNRNRVSEDICVFPEKIKDELPLYTPKSKMIEKLDIKNIEFISPSNRSFLQISYNKIKKGEILQDPLAASPVYLRSTDVIFKKRND